MSPAGMAGMQLAGQAILAIGETLQVAEKRGWNSAQALAASRTWTTRWRYSLPCRMNHWQRPMENRGRLAHHRRPHTQSVTRRTLLHLAAPGVIACQTQPTESPNH